MGTRGPREKLSQFHAGTKEVWEAFKGFLCLLVLVCGCRRPSGGPWGTGRVGRPARPTQGSTGFPAWAWG